MTMPAKDDGQLSDWDSDEDIERVDKPPRKRVNSIINVRDRTAGLSNVYQGQAVEKSSFAFSSLKPTQYSNFDKKEIPAV